MLFPKYGSLKDRRQRGKYWGKRSGVARASARLRDGVDAETLHRRALHDAKGRTIREGCTYTATSERPWLLRRSLRGRTNQVDLLIAGELVRTCGLAAADSAIRWVVWPRAAQASSVATVNLRGGKVGASSVEGRTARD